MKTKTIILSAAMLLGSMAVQAKSPKRGLSENQFQYKAQMAAVSPGVSWFYNWGSSVGNYLAGEEDMEFVPMCWNGNYNEQAIRDYVAAHPQVKYLLGFNEPNFTAQANMTPAVAAAQWPAVRALADELGLRLVAPALNYSPNAPYQDPTKWMDEFVALVGNDAFDFVAIHNYGGFGVLQSLATTFHDRYGKDVWVTEFCLWPNEGDPNSYVAPESQIASMIQSVEWLEKTPWIYRYAWFKAIGNSSASKGPNYGLLISGKGEEPRELSEQGKVYVYMPDFDTEAFNAVGTVVPAKDFIAQNAVLLGSNTDAALDCPIEITRFNAGAWADYQFDVPESGEATLTLRVAGVGEPVRFDPTIGIYAVNADGTEGASIAPARQLTLSGQDDVYNDVTFSLNLSAGRQTIRVKDTAPYSPSGIRISSLRLDMGRSAITEIGAGASGSLPVDVYSLQGIRVRGGVAPASALDGLPAGIYIVGGRKTVKN